MVECMLFVKPSGGGRKEKEQSRGQDGRSENDRMFESGRFRISGFHGFFRNNILVAIKVSVEIRSVRRRQAQELNEMQNGRHKVADLSLSAICRIARVYAIRLQSEKMPVFPLRGHR